MKKLIIIVMILFYTILGCSKDSDIKQIFISESSDGTIYKCLFQQIELEDNNFDCIFTLTKEPDDHNLSMHMEGKVQCMTLSEKGNLLCIAIRPFVGTTFGGNKNLSSYFEIIFINTDTLKESHRWRIKPQKKPDNREESLQRFDEIDISDDGTLVITYYWIDGNGAVNLWDAKTGEFIREYFLPPDNPALQGKIYSVFVSDITISQNNDFVAIAGFWAIKGSQNINPGNFLYIWHIKDGTCEELRFKETYDIQKLCFDASGNYIACHNKTMIMIYDASESKLVHSQDANNSIDRIDWNDNKKAFQIKIKNQPDIFISPEEIKGH